MPNFRRGPTAPVAVALAAVLLAAGSALPRSARAGDPRPFSAREGRELAVSAARAWAEDARLVYVENDEPVTAGGGAERWGYLFRSEARAGSRAYSVRDGEIRVATDPPFDFDAPPLTGEWIDSGRALAAADAAVGTKYRGEHAGRVRSLFLLRGAMDPEHPEVPTWAVVYESDSAPGLWVVVNARSGEVVKRWRG